MRNVRPWTKIIPSKIALLLARGRAGTPFPAMNRHRVAVRRAGQRDRSAIRCHLQRDVVPLYGAAQLAGAAWPVEAATELRAALIDVQRDLTDLASTTRAGKLPS